MTKKKKSHIWEILLYIALIGIAVGVFGFFTGLWLVVGIIVLALMFIAGIIGLVGKMIGFKGENKK